MEIAQLADNGDIVVDPHNQRIRVLSYEAAAIPRLHAALLREGQQNDLHKIIMYAKKADVPALLELGYRQEGKIDGFFRGENAQMLSYFLTPERAASTAPALAEENLRLSLAKGRAERRELPDGYRLRDADEGDADALAALYRQVFPVYPTPMDDAAYIRKTMREGTCYVVAETDDGIACAASAEISARFGSAEMTDCATHPAHAGRGLLQPLFAALEEKMKAKGIYYLYTLTRAQSAAMNITAARQGYAYRGRLINNCRISSGYEDMNIWVKPLKETWE
ncbi:putative beta-lysine N-acetyltransferase [Brevibacillus sp. SYP-B805]|uniref:putative beta-lysine N-acetyltransferase n=1 Tax=Brevibacillus sp. SYP-B805 TaxID=1578199 RepID=UPI0013ED1750|nr:putative beta-lysine N-acetyltransferase [Brevibacillus sp. SYP-B805]NGQ97070.1 putative beta-lysine N-acetyltransferase [Brevibacillus sp. SYP-B805]